MKQIEVLNWAFSILKEHKREEQIANILMQHHLNCTQTEFYMNMREMIQPEIITKFKQDIFNHINTGKPVQHLIGYDYFYGEKFIVNEHTLIPRQETEELVDLMINTYPQDTKLTFVDLGTGSGVIAITLAKHFKRAQIIASDISNQALIVAKKNALLHDVNIQFLKGDFLEPIIKSQLEPNIIVSNPPYIDHADLPTLSDTVKDFDPHQALFAKNKGLAAYETIMHQIAELAEEPQAIYFEIGRTQASSLIDMYNKVLPNYQVKIKKDLNAKDRIIMAELKER